MMTAHSQIEYLKTIGFEDIAKDLESLNSKISEQSVTLNVYNRCSLQVCGELNEIVLDAKDREETTVELPISFINSLIEAIYTKDASRLETRNSFY